MSTEISTDKPREYTTDEVRAIFFRHVYHMVDYWLNESRAPTTREKMEGLAFSIFSALDGSTLNLPAFEIRCSPHPADKDYHRDQGENWFPEGVDIGPLHEFMHRYKP